MGSFSTMSLAKRGRLYRLRRHVPHRYRSIKPRETVWISLHTDSETIARARRTALGAR